MKKTNLFTVSIVILSLLLTVVGCASKTESESKSASVPKATSEAKVAGNYKDGTYEGTSDAGNKPGLKLKVVVKDEKIAEINIVEQNETDGVGSAILESLPAEIIKAQSTNVDSVTGASKTSVAIKEAVDKALSQAKK